MKCLVEGNDVPKGAVFAEQTRWFLVVFVVVFLVACGKKGPPLPPVIQVPDGVGSLVVQRLANEVQIGFTVPDQDVDGSTPADLERIDIYAMTTQPRIPADRVLDLEEFQDAATLIHSLEVRPPLGSTQAEEVTPTHVVTGEALVDQGFPVMFRERLTPETLIPVDPWEDERVIIEDEKLSEGPLIVPLVTPPLPGPLQREYAIVGVSTRGHESEASERPRVPLGIQVPEPPSALQITYSESIIEVAWELPNGVRLPVQEPVTAAPDMFMGEQTLLDAVDAALAGESGSAGESVSTTEAAEPAEGGVETGAVQDPVLPLFPLESTPIGSWPLGSRYEIFGVLAGSDEETAVPELLNVAPLEVPEYADDRVTFGEERCYALRTVDIVSTLEIRSQLSRPTCVTLADTFPPQAPRNLSAVGSDGEVNLIWEPNEEEDLAGYRVLRGLPPGDNLQPVTEVLVEENTFRDSSAESDVRYVYAVQAVDNAPVSNISAESNTVEEAAR